MGDLNAYFSRRDFACHCPRCNAAGPIVTDTLVDIVFGIRQAIGLPLEIAAGLRCVAHNTEIGGAPDSRHLPEFADAADIACHDSNLRYQVVAEAINRGVRFIEVCPGHVHLDLRPGAYRLIQGVDH